MKKITGILLLIMVSIMMNGCQKKEPDKKDTVLDQRNLTPFEYSMMNLVGTDALGRNIERKDQYKTDKERYVGLFYSVWLGQHPESQQGIYNITELMETEEGLAILNDPEGSSKSKTGDFHFWGEPLYGYYNSSDPWVSTRHIELLTMAGIDYLAIDTTNSIVYKDSITVLLNTLLKYQEQGFKVPKVLFYTNSYSGTTVDKIYADFYQTEKYYDIWFKPNGKPMIIGITENNQNASDQTKYGEFTDFIDTFYHEIFDIKESQWPNGDYNANAIPWMSWQYPQWNHNGSISVPVAQHSHSRISASFMDPETKRGYNNLTGTIDPNFRAGTSFQTMWDSVFKAEQDIHNVVVTSFNEWMAIKYVNANGVYFVDVYNEEHSRDLEMMRGGYNDNFYLQLMSNLRRFKMTDAKTYQHTFTNIDIKNESSIVLWDFVKSHYKDFAGDALKRDHQGAVRTLKYQDQSNRNDITDIKVAHNNTYLFFYVKTLEAITAYNGSDLNWMNIWIQTDSEKSHFEGYNYVLNRHPKQGVTSLERSTGGYQFELVGDVEYTIKDNVMQVAIPIELLGLSANNLHLAFKVSDNVTNFSDIMDYYVTGDSAPIGRLSFYY